MIVVDRLLTGFDAPCLSTLYIDRQPMQLHDIIQAFSRTNRIFDHNKQFGQIVTFRSPRQFKETIDNALKLFSAGGLGEAVPKVWEEVEPAFMDALKQLREAAARPEDISGLSEKEKKAFAKSFQNFDSLLAQLKAFTNLEGKSIEDYGISEQEYEDYAAHYKNVMDALKAGKEENDENEGSDSDDSVLDPDPDYELTSYSKATIDYEYILNLIQNIVSSMEDETENEESLQKKIEEVREYIDEMEKENPKLAGLMRKILTNLEQDRSIYKGRNISEIFESMKKDAFETVIHEFAEKWYADGDAVRYAALYSSDGEILNANVLKETANYGEYRENTEEPLQKFAYRSMMIKELGQMIEEEILPLKKA
ncbi:MAG: type I restriction endonuclease subunit R [Lachnospiraceae bacterium]|nr:type I restriction endonuclease subunit R [Lachnospiraceae bacterium]